MKNIEYSQDLHLKHGGHVQMGWEREADSWHKYPDACGDAVIYQGNMDGDMPDQVHIVIEPEGRFSVTQCVILTHEEAVAVAKFILENVGRRF